MKKYLISVFSDNGYIFRCLLCVDKVPGETDRYFIQRIICDDSNGRLIFEEVPNHYITWCFSHPMTESHGTPKDRIKYDEDRDLLIDFRDDQEALLWYKLNY